MYHLIVIALAVTSNDANSVKFEAEFERAAAPVAGALASIDSQWTLRIEGVPNTVGKLIEVRQMEKSRPALPWDKPHILLANGDRWAGEIVASKNDSVRFRPSIAYQQEVEVPISSLVAAWLKPAKHGSTMTPANRELIADKRDQDCVCLDNGDVVRGTLNQISDREIALNVGEKPSVFPRDRIAAIAFCSELSRVPKIQRPFGRVVTADGSRLKLAKAQIQDGRLIGTSQFGFNIRIPLSDLICLQIDGPPTVYLSDLKTSNYEHMSFLDIPWPLMVDRSSSGDLLRLHTGTYDRGIGLHSHSRAVYAVPVGARRFQARVGLDPVHGQKGNVRVLMQIDGRDAMTPLTLAGAAESKRVDVPVADGAQELALIVEFGVGGDVQDHVNWADARFIIPGSE